MPIGEREPRPDKVAIVDELKEVLQSSTLILTEYQGLNVKAISTLRKALRDSGSGYKVVKNTLLRLAAKGTAVEALAEELQGPTAVIYSEDPVAAAKAFQDFVKAAKADVAVKSGLVDGHTMTAAQVDELAKLPPKEQLYAMVVGGIQAPISNLVGTLQQMISQLVFTLQAVADKKAA